MTLTHKQLEVRARVWLRNTRKCKPVFSNNASCQEIPDAIGWSSHHRWYGSTVVECKTSASDFYADKKKRLRWKPANYGEGKCYPKCISSRISEKAAADEGLTRIEIPTMGDYRFYMCEPGVITAKMVEEHAPDHGLLYVEGRTVKVVRAAPERTNVDLHSEIRYLRFVIINRKIESNDQWDYSDAAVEKSLPEFVKNTVS